MQYMQKEYKKYNSILKTVSNKASTNMEIMAVIDKKTILAICFYINYKFKDTFKPF